MSTVKLLICYHKKFPIFKDDVLTPIHVGRALSNPKKNPDHNWLVKNMIGDDTGDNISKENGYYNEMSAIYWAWKNYKKLGNPDYIGLMHYRRHFVLNPGEIDVYNIRDFNENTYLDEINYSSEAIQKLVEGYDFLPHIGRVNNIYRHYTENQRKRDLDTVLNIVEKKYPDYVSYMEEYFNGDYSNFCNMCIFSKKIFFEYCEWIFSIMKEFEKYVNVNDKRFFISERLTGLFIHKLMKDRSLKYKELPISFIDEPAKVQIAMSIDKGTVNRTALSLHSIMKNAERYHSFHFHLIGSKKQVETVKSDFEIFEKKYSNCHINFIEDDTDAALLPLVIPELLPKEKKCIYISGDTIALKDISEFYRICSTDDYFLVGVPKEKYDPRDTEKSIVSDLIVINCARMRKHNISQKAKKLTDKRYVRNDYLNSICKGETSYIPWYLFTSERLSLSSTQVFIPWRRRSEVQSEALWRPFFLYDYSNPAENNQGIFSKFWWDMYLDLPLPFQQLDANITVLKELYAIQQQEINEFVHGDKHLTPELKENKNNEPDSYSGFSYTLSQALLVSSKIKRLPLKDDVVINGFRDNISPEETDVRSEEQPPETPQTEDWRSYGFMGKLKFYYKNNGLKQTIKYAFVKMRGKS